MLFREITESNIRQLHAFLYVFVADEAFGAKVP